MDRLDTMHTFVRVAELGSFSEAARQMDVARSVVTRQIAALEARLGSKLIARSTRSLALTSAGSAYLEKCREILNLVEAADGVAAQEHQAPRGLLRVSVPLSFGLRHLAPLLTDFSVTYPEVTVDLDFTDRRVKLIEEGLDMAIRITAQLDPLDVARRIGFSRLVVVASPDYLRRHGEPTHPAQLADHQCLVYLPSQQAGWTFLIDGQAQRFPVTGRLRANNGDAILDASCRGLGISCQPTFIAAPALEAGRVKAILTAYRMPELGIHALLPGNRYVPHRVRVLIDYLAERIGARPYWEGD